MLLRTFVRIVDPYVPTWFSVPRYLFSLLKQFLARSRTTVTICRRGSRTTTGRYGDNNQRQRSPQQRPKTPRNPRGWLRQRRGFLAAISRHSKVDGGRKHYGSQQKFQHIYYNCRRSRVPESGRVVGWQGEGGVRRGGRCVCGRKGGARRATQSWGSWSWRGHECWC